MADEGLCNQQKHVVSCALLLLSEKQQQQQQRVADGPGNAQYLWRRPCCQTAQANSTEFSDKKTMCTIEQHSVMLCALLTLSISTKFYIKSQNHCIVVGKRLRGRGKIHLLCNLLKSSAVVYFMHAKSSKFNTFCFGVFHISVLCICANTCSLCHFSFYNAAQFTGTARARYLSWAL